MANEKQILHILADMWKLKSWSWPIEEGDQELEKSLVREESS
jgi:hypothetical protein